MSTNIYDLVERSAARHGLRRLELWQKVVRDLLSGELPALNLSDPINSRVAPMTLGDWLIGFRAAVNRQSDPNRVARFLKRIMVLETDFQKWFRNINRGKRGPVVGTTGYIASDRELFPAMNDLLNSGKARSPHDAALMLAKDDKVAGPGTLENRAKRLSTRYWREAGARKPKLPETN